MNAISYKVTQFAGDLDKSTRGEIAAYLDLHHPNLKELTIEPLEAKGHDAGSMIAGWDQGAKANLHRAVEGRSQGALGFGGGK